MSSNRIRISTVLLVLASTYPAAAQYMTEPSAERLPPQFGDVAIVQRLNQQIPLDLGFRDETGQTVTLRRYFQPDRPVILNLVYYNCSMICGEVMEGLASALSRVKFDLGQQYEVLTVSFDPRDTPAIAVTTKAKYVQVYGRPGAEEGWHFLTGDQPSIRALTDAVGFHYYWDKRTQQFAHAAGIMLLTPEGRVAQYYYGARYYPSDLRLGLVQASQNHIGTLADQIVLYCYHYDPRTGRYGAIVSRVVQIAGGFTVLILGGLIVFLLRSDPNRRRRRGLDVLKAEDVREESLQFSRDARTWAERRGGD